MMIVLISLFCVTPRDILFQLHLVMKMCLCLLSLRCFSGDQKEAVAVATVTSPHHLLLSFRDKTTNILFLLVPSVSLVFGTTANAFCCVFFTHDPSLLSLSVSPPVITWRVLSQNSVPFSVSSLSLLGPCVEGGQCRLPPCG